MKHPLFRQLTATAVITGLALPQIASTVELRPAAEAVRSRTKPIVNQEAAIANTNSDAPDQLTPAEIQQKIEEQRALFEQHQEIQERIEREKIIEEGIESGVLPDEVETGTLEKAPDGSLQIVVPEAAQKLKTKTEPTNDDSSTNDTNEESGEDVTDDTVTTEDKPDREALKERRRRFHRPTFVAPEQPDLGSTVEQAGTFFQEAAQNLDGFAHVPAEQQVKIQELTEEISTELETLVTALQSTTDPEEREVIREQIRELVAQKQAERRQLIADSVQLPPLPSLAPASDLSARLEQISQRLAETGVNTTELNASIKSFGDAVTQAQQLVKQVQTDPSIENLRALREQLQALKSLRDQLRNQLQSVPLD